MDNTQKAFQDYVNTATDLAESVKRDIQRDGYVSEKTISNLNKFVIATNELASLNEDMLDINEEDPNLN